MANDSSLSADDFSEFYRQAHGFPPFPWQERLLRTIVANDGKWPRVLDLPTGSGKTSAIDVAVFHLALEAVRQSERRAAVRIAFVVDRRLVVDDAYRHAQALGDALIEAPSGGVMQKVSQRLGLLAGADAPPLIVRRLRGGVPKEPDWAHTPAQPTVLCSTVDQVGSRLLFRGYGVSDSKKPIHAGLIGSDCLILLDEAHLAEPFRQTLGLVEHYRSASWRESGYAGPWGAVLLSATPGVASQDAVAPFPLEQEDRDHPVLRRRLEASKPALLVEIKASRKSTDSDDEAPEVEQATRSQAIVEQVRAAFEHFSEPANGAPRPAIGVVVNRVARAREVWRALSGAEFVREALYPDAAPILMIGPARAVDRAELANQLNPIRTRHVEPGQQRLLEWPVIVVATQCIEAGVDIDLDALISDAAPLDALRQRFGRLNRAGRELAPYAALIAGKTELSTRYVDPIYGSAIRATWEQLREAATDAGPRKSKVFDFGLAAFKLSMYADVMARKNDAPVLMPAHLDLLSQTAPIPEPDPDPALFLHGAGRSADSVTVVWRGDLAPKWMDDEATRHLLTLAPPRSGEAIELPLWAVQRWLRGAGTPELADVPGAALDSAAESGTQTRRAFVWKGDSEHSRWVNPSALRAGATVVVPAGYGGVDRYGWNPTDRTPATDAFDAAAAPYRDRRYVVRVAPGLIGERLRADDFANALQNAVSSRWRDLRDALQPLPLPEDLREQLMRLNDYRGRQPQAYLDCYGIDDEGRPRGVVFVAMYGISEAVGEQSGMESISATEDDTSGSLPGYRLSLEAHSRDVESYARQFATQSGLTTDRVADLACAGFLHDAGKADSRFQAWLHHGDPLGPDPDDASQILAKSDRPLPRKARRASLLPERWRHEALSVRLALAGERLKEAADSELVVWLVGTHHGHGRPLFPHSDPEDARQRHFSPLPGLVPVRLPAGSGPQSLAFDWNGQDWPNLFRRLKSRYGVWELARMEAILRLADHRASEHAQAQASGDTP